MSLIRNERVKLTATWLNTIAAATVVTGVIAPAVAFVFGFPGSGMMSSAVYSAAATAWFLLGIGLHVLARYVLGLLRE